MNIQKKHKEFKTIPLEKCLAKTIKIKKDGKIIYLKGSNVFTHCYITGFVAKKLIKLFPLWLQKLLFPKGADLICASHDIGKISSFQEDIYKNIGENLNIFTSLSTKIYHSEVSEAALSIYSEKIAKIAGRHHGYSSNNVGDADAEKYGGISWKKLRDQLLEKLKNSFDIDFPIIETDIQADAISGLTCITDWISSGSFFENVKEEDLKTKDFQKMIDTAIINAGYIKPIIKKGLSFNSLFGFDPWDIQLKLIDVVNDRGIYILEAPMGIGKTEAALYAAYKMLEQGLATGIYFALPTQLTSNRIFSRVKEFLSKILESDQSPLLLHSDAWLQQTEIGKEGGPGGSWFNIPKRGLLAPFSIGTVDQALMAAINVKHNFVRAFGLAGKVVILDEIHSYDSYTGTIINVLTNILNEMGCTVIILSATLTEDRRRELLSSPQKLSNNYYPLISSKKINESIIEYPVEQKENKDIWISFSHNNLNTIDFAIGKALSNQQILWIENDVNSAQKIFKMLKARCLGYNIDCGIIHSRYLKKSRDGRESYWIDLYGKEGGKHRKKCGRILIGTQVLEQSLDIDADFLITRLCPTDMLIQRIGRLWRHPVIDSFRPKNAKREVCILAPEMNKVLNDKNAFGSSGFVYSPYVLYRTLDLWKDLKSITIPKHIPYLIESTYSERFESGLIYEHKRKLFKEKEKLKNLAINGTAKNIQTLPDYRTPTRYSEIESVDVLLLKSMYTQNDGSTITFIDGEHLNIPTIHSKEYKSNKKIIAAKILSNCVKVPERKAPIVTKKQLGLLEGYIYLGEKDDSYTPFRAAIVTSDGSLTGLGNENITKKYKLLYSKEIGYIAEKI